ncbi:MAG: helix-hairpin-helix domain-containing protein [Syntrophales bacterium]
MQTADRQLRGAVLLVLCLNILYLARAALVPESPFSSPAPPYSEKKEGYRTVEISGDPEIRGVYFVPAGTTVSGLLDLAGASGRPGIGAEERARVLADGDRINIGREEGSGPGRKLGPKLEKMSQSARFVLDLPMDLNSASVRELMQVPGIGEKTAEAISASRGELGGFGEVDDLRLVRGIGEKKLASFRKYFIVEMKKQR